MAQWARVPVPAPPAASSPGGPAPPPTWFHGLAAAASELLLAALTFFVGLSLVLGLPGLQTAVYWLLDHTLGRPDLAPEKIRQAQAVILTPLATLVAAGLYAWLGRRVDGLAPPPAAAWPRVGLLAAAGQVLLHLFLAIAGSYALSLVMHLLGAPVVEQGLVLEITASGDLRRPELATLAFSALVLAPIGEELFFRRQLLRRSWLRSGPAVAYGGSALLFAAFHGNLRGLVVYLWLGLVFARVYARTGRLAAAMAVHAGNNAITLAILLLAPPT